MKRYTLLLLILILMASFVSAQDLFVTSRIGTIVAEPSRTASRVAIVRQGDQLEQLENLDGWYRVATTAGEVGYIQELFVGGEPSAPQVSEGGLQNISNVTTRRRASAYSTSAAATRGLDADNPRERQNLSFEAYDFQTVSWVKRFEYGEEALLEFAAQEGIGL